MTYPCQSYPNPPVTFDFTAWSQAYPAFPNVSAAQAQEFFNTACLICPNSAANPMVSSGNLQTLLYLLTAHVAALNMRPQTSSGAAVGRISSATEGSVSVSMEWNGSGSPSEAWYLQTQYGATYWQATAGYRFGRYVANPTFVPTAVFPMGYRRRGW